jgi:hypothetical protein
VGGQRIALMQLRPRGHGKTLVERKVVILLTKQRFITSLSMAGGRLAHGSRRR